MGGPRCARVSPSVALLVGLAYVALRWHASSAADDGTALAYIGPGAGIALLGSFFAVAMALLSAVAAMFTWPIRRIWRMLRGRRAYAQAKVKRVVVLGLDGLEPTLTERFLAEGLLPNMAKLREMGTYLKLGTSCPPLSPVAWSCFTTGTNPGKHNIFDFITRNPADYRPMISSVRIREPRRKLKLGKYVIPLSRPEISALRKSKPFWTVLGEHGVFGAILRVPITFPPDRFRGVQLSAMCVPDLRGTQGMFSFYAEDTEEGATMDGDVGGDRIRVHRNGHGVESFLRGPVNSLLFERAELRVPFRVTSDGNGAALLHVNGTRQALPLDRYSDWVRVTYHAAPGIKVHGICRFYLKSLAKPFQMYCTPVQIDPDKPVMPISHPHVYSQYLARRQGSFATLGLAEDTWALSEHVLSEDAFLTAAYDIHAEREDMFFDALERVRSGVVVCVFDAPDRIQHMFWRFIDDDHPALRGRPNTHADSIRDMYVRMDQLVGRTMEKLDLAGGEALIVMSDHGFKPFRRGVDLNAWLRDDGYLKLKDGKRIATATYLGDIDWSQTKAYAIGLAGIFINQKGREKHGIVEPGDETRKLVSEIAEKLTGLRDAETGQVGIHEAMPRGKVYHGPYLGNAPDIIIGYDVGYRVSWDAAVGKCGEHVFCDNVKAWSGDHCIHPERVPGILFSNLKLRTEGARIIDVGPTTLDLFGIPTPEYMDGETLLCADAKS